MTADEDSGDPVTLTVERRNATFGAVQVCYFCSKYSKTSFLTFFGGIFYVLCESGRSQLSCDMSIVQQQQQKINMCGDI